MWLTEQFHVTLNQSADNSWFSLDSDKSKHQIWHHIRKQTLERRLLKFLVRNQTRPWYLRSTSVLLFSVSSAKVRGRERVGPREQGKVGRDPNVGEKGQKNCPESKDKASKELGKLLKDQICHDHRHVISKWSLSVQSIKKYPSPWPLQRA